MAQVGAHTIRELLTHYDLDALINNNANFKSRLIEWAQREGKEVRFVIVQENDSRHFREFIPAVARLCRVTVINRLQAIRVYFFLARSL